MACSIVATTSSCALAAIDLSRRYFQEKMPQLSIDDAVGADYTLSSKGPIILLRFDDGKKEAYTAAYLVCDDNHRNHLLKMFPAKVQLGNIKKIVKGKVPYAVAILGEDVTKLDNDLDTLVDGELKTSGIPTPPDCKTI